MGDRDGEEGQESDEGIKRGQTIAGENGGSASFSLWGERHEHGERDSDP